MCTVNYQWPKALFETFKMIPHHIVLLGIEACSDEESTFLEVKVTNHNKEATVSMKNKRFTSNLFKSCGRKIRRKSSSALLHKQFFSNYELSRLQNRFRVVKWREFCKYRISDPLAFKKSLLQISQLVH